LHTELKLGGRFLLLLLLLLPLLLLPLLFPLLLLLASISAWCCRSHTAPPPREAKAHPEAAKAILRTKSVPRRVSRDSRRAPEQRCE
jgi:hypothetical protein